MTVSSSQGKTLVKDRILQVLATYQKDSGQMVNLDKSEVSFSQNVPIEERNMICEMMGVTTVESHT